MRIIGNVKDSKSLANNELLAFERRNKQIEHEQSKVHEPEPSVNSVEETEGENKKETQKQETSTKKKRTKSQV